MNMNVVTEKSIEQSVPAHIAIIMDGNRRWAREHKLPVLEGHRRVANDVLEKLVEHAARRGVSYMTLWAFSTENWNRAEDEVKGIMRILAHSIGVFGKKMYKRGVQLRVIGDLSRFDGKLQKAIQDVVLLTKDNKRITVTIALNYGGRDEIIRAIKKVSSIKYQVSGKNITLETLTPDTFSSYLDTAGIPDPDCIVRTGGEKRLSGFLLWQSQYSELIFTDFYMPDFTPQRLDEVITEFTLRQRRFGK
jgi:undecaprenyl diphosphate synthase